VAEPQNRKLEAQLLHASSDTAPLPGAFAGLIHPTRLVHNKRRRFEKLAAQQRIVVSAHIALDFPGKGSIAVHVDDGPSWVAARLAPSAGLVAV